MRNQNSFVKFKVKIISFLRSLNWSTLISNLLLVTGVFIGFYKWTEEQKEKRKYDLYIKKEQIYLSLQKNMWGFYDNSFDMKKQQNFVEDIQTAWLYCPDSIIFICNNFIKSRIKNSNISKEEAEKIISKLMLEMRKDLLSNKYLEETNLSTSDYLNVYPIQDTSANRAP